MGGQPPVNDRRVGGKHNTVKQADSGLGGWMLRKFQGENLRSDSTLHIRYLPHDLVTGGIPHAGSRHDPIDGSPPGSPFPGILQARTLEWVAISFSNIYLSEDLKYQALARL